MLESFFAEKSQTKQSPLYAHVYRKRILVHSELLHVSGTYD